MVCDVWCVVRVGCSLCVVCGSLFDVRCALCDVCWLLIGSRVSLVVPLCLARCLPFVVCGCLVLFFVFFCQVLDRCLLLNIRVFVR